MEIREIVLKGEVETDFKGWEISLELYHSPYSTSVYYLSSETFSPVHLVCFGNWPMPSEQRWIIDGLRYYKYDEIPSRTKNKIVFGNEEIVCNSFFLTTEFSVREYMCDPEKPSGNVQFASWTIE